MPLNVLVVDDSSVARSMIIRVLELTGLPLGQVLQAANGQEGLDVLEGNWVDVVLVDINMPVMNGEEMICRLRSRDEWRDIPIIVVSTESSTTRIERLREHRVQFVHKPFTPEAISEVILQTTGVTNGTK